MPLSDWQPIIPRHGRLLAFLRDRAQKRDTEFGIGTGALRDQGDVFTIEQLTEPLYERGMIETLAGYRPAGHLFTRITGFGSLCLDFGMMPKSARKDPASVERYAKEAFAEMKKKLEAPAIEGQV
jgi:hypothetical protein